jgi:hypothetical protein
MNSFLFHKSESLNLSHVLNTETYLCVCLCVFSHNFPFIMPFHDFPFSECPILTVMWYIEESCSLGYYPIWSNESHQCFGGTYHLHLQGRRVIQTRNQNEAGSRHTSALCMLFSSSIFSLEDGDSMFLQAGSN